MKYSKLLFATAAAAALVFAGGVAKAADAPGKGVTIYMQMGGNPGDGSTLARQTGAAAAAAALGVDKLSAQFATWAPETMIDQFKQALAAKPSCIVIMGHPGADAFAPLVKQAVEQGIVVTDGNAPLTSLQDQTISTVPRLLVVVGLLMAALPWFLARLMNYTIGLFSDFHRFLGQG